MKKVLIIEDDVEIQKIYEELLKGENCEVFHAHVGKQGLDLAKIHKPSVIILDIMLPGGLNGFDVLEDLKRDIDLKNIPVLVLTNLDTEATTAKSIGAAEYLVKTNTSINDVVEKVKKYLN